MKIIDRGTVYSAQPGTNHQSCTFPGICVLSSGRWVCSFRAAPTKLATTDQHVLITWSDDKGRNWSTPTEPFKPPIPDVDGKCGVFREAYVTASGANSILACIYWVDHSDPSLPFFNEETEGLLDSRIFLAWSEDGGATWNNPKLMDTSPFNIPTPLTGPILCLPNGELGCHFELNKHYYETSQWRHSSVIMFSADGGGSWGEHVITSNDPANRFFLWDQKPGILADGTILDLFWTYDNHASIYLNIRARQSTDNGRTWSRIWDTNVPGQPAQPVSTPDGSIAMVYVDRTAAPMVKIRKSTDGGKTWPDESEIILYQTASKSQTQKKGTMQDAWAEMGKYSIGLPATSVLPDGDVLVVYYAGPETDKTDIQWVRVRVGSE